VANVLIVDDRAADRELAVVLLEHAGHDVTSVDAPSEALSRLEEGAAPDLLIVDVLMPGMTGFELVQQLRTQGVALPVIFMSSTFGEEAADFARHVSGTRFVRKASDPEAILAAVDEALRAPAPATGERGPGADDAHLRLLNERLYDAVENLERLQAERETLLDQLGATRIEERQRLAVDLHDDVVQVLAAVGMRLDLLERKLENTPLEDHVGPVRSAVGDAISRIREMIADLRPAEIAAEGLAATITRQLTDVFAGETGFDVDSRLEHDPPLDTAVAMFRIACEAAVNAHRHGNARHVDIRLAREDGEAVVRVQDDGTGFDPAVVEARSGHVGLAGMRERTEAAGGTITIESAPGSGCTVEARIPLNGPA
jgi:signal transduction histidine kinase